MKNILMLFEEKVFLRGSFFGLNFGSSIVKSLILSKDAEDVSKKHNLKSSFEKAFKVP